MSSLDVRKLEPGMITSAPVKTKSGQLIMDEGVELTTRLIARLSFYSIKSIHVTEDSLYLLKEPEPAPEPTPKSEPVVEEKPPVEPEPVVAAEPESVPEPTPKVDSSQFINAGNASYSQKIKRSDRFKNFQVDYTRNVVELKTSFKKLMEGESVDVNQLLNSSMGVINEQRLNTIELFDMLHNMRQVDDSTYAHSLNVAYIARILGKWLKYDNEEIKLLTMAGLLHDIGKTMIPSPILNKPGKLTDAEYEIVKMHPQFGYDLLKDKDLPEKVLQTILHHHERCDSSGYPDHLAKQDLDDFTMVIAIADVYDAMTAARSYRGPLCPFTVIEEFEKDGLQKFLPHVILTFLERIANTYQHNRVMLSDGTSGTIILLNNAHLARPIVQRDNGDFVDLSTTPSLSITSII